MESHNSLYKLEAMWTSIGPIQWWELPAHSVPGIPGLVHGYCISFDQLGSYAMRRLGKTDPVITGQLPGYPKVPNEGNLLVRISKTLVSYKI